MSRLDYSHPQVPRSRVNHNLREMSKLCDDLDSYDIDNNGFCTEASGGEFDSEESYMD